MRKKRFRYVFHRVDSDEIMLDTTDPIEMLDYISPRFHKSWNEYDVLHEIEIYYGKIVRTLDNLLINKDILKRLSKKQ